CRECDFLLRLRGKLRSVMVMPSLVCARCEVEVMSLARLQSLQGGPAVLGIGEQVPLGCDIAGDGNRPIADAPLNPRARYLQLSSQLGNRQPPGEVAWVCPTGASQHAVTLANDLHRPSSSGRRNTLTEGVA